jgi:hypothetical protein
LSSWLDSVADFNDELDFVDGLAEVGDSILGLVAAHPLDDATLEEGEVVAINENSGLDFEVLVVVAVDLSVKGRGSFWIFKGGAFPLGLVAKVLAEAGAQGLARFGFRIHDGSPKK